MTTIYTIGHSTRQIDEFTDILAGYGIGLLVDIRTVPRSRHNPQYERSALETSLAGVGIEYMHSVGLGGLRPKVKGSVNDGWRNESFRNYADHMQTAEFRAAVAELAEAAESQTTVIMCAEAVPWRCHRSLVGDALLVRGIGVTDIMSAANAVPHALTSFAVVDGTEITYPAAQ